jgi:hypothetical protein
MSGPAVEPIYAHQEQSVNDLAPGDEFVGAGQLMAHRLHGTQRAVEQTPEYGSSIRHA